ncbi:DUF4214 domain-containing protein [Pigmentiphaga aceris]|uniref:DUF4214 domain-containing protein n=1 Tax=Pigmentiphaga aceris TaxID=1940612 RepID=A0A5C0B401_9BURK|nr:DUF4214 domain-containing protein [Pigmentiphaga aceris]QEI08664.1 DUF4214 domain-containing protein [Pigmentiphaga aceris]
MATAAQLTQITNLYVSLFNRVPDTEGLNFWSSALAGGASIDTITQGFLNAPEGIQTYSPFLSAQDFVTDFYTTVFGRAPDEAGLAFWVAALNNAGGADSTAARAQVVSGIVTAVTTPLTAAQIADPAFAQSVEDRGTFANKVAVGVYYGSALNTSLTSAQGFDLSAVDETAASVATAKAAAFLTIATTANVTGTASDDVFTLPVAFTGTLDGRGGNDTAILQGGTAIDLAKVSNVETLRFNSYTTTVDTSKVTGVTSYEASAGTATLTGLTTQTLGVIGAGVINATFNKAATSATVLLKAATAGSGVTIANGTDAAVTTLNLNGAGVLSTLAVDSTVTTLNIASTGKGISLTAAVDSDITTIDASASTGAVSVIVGANQSYKGGSGVDTVTLDASPTKAIDGGAGDNDVLVIDAVAGVVTLNAGITGFETLGLGANASGAYDASAFKHLLVNQPIAAAVSATNVAAGTDLTIGGNVDFTYALANTAGKADSLNLALKATTALTTTVTAAGIETINISTTDSSATLPDTAIQHALTLEATGATSIVVTGNTGLTLTNTGNTAVTSFDASAVTAGEINFVSENTTVGAAVSIKGSLVGANNLEGGVTNDTIVGGAGDDVITSGTGLDVLTGGAGDDQFILSANSGVTSLIYATITDFAAGDSIDVTSLATSGFATTTLTQTTLPAGATLAQLTAQASQGNGAVGDALASWFQFGGDTYIVVDNSAGNTFVEGADQLVKLNGVIDLTNADIAAGVITLA